MPTGTWSIVNNYCQRAVLGNHCPQLLEVGLGNDLIVQKLNNLIIVGYTAEKW